MINLSPRILDEVYPVPFGQRAWRWHISASCTKWMSDHSNLIAENTRHIKQSISDKLHEEHRSYDL